MEKQEKNNHAGHRNRLRDKVKQNGLKSLAPHEVLELLLTYVIPRANTNGTAHNLLNTYGSLYGVLNADRRDLAKVAGVGERSAFFLSMLPEFIELYLQSRKPNEDRILSTQDAITYFRQNFSLGDKEYFHFVCLNGMGKIVKRITYTGDSCTNVSINLKKFNQEISGDNVDAVIMFHTHPFGSPEPSAADILTTQEIYFSCAALHVRLVDHIIVGETKHYSFSCRGKLDEIANNYAMVKQQAQKRIT